MPRRYLKERSTCMRGSGSHSFVRHRCLNSAYCAVPAFQITPELLVCSPVYTRRLSSVLHFPFRNCGRVRLQADITTKSDVFSYPDSGPRSVIPSQNKNRGGARSEHGRYVGFAFNGWVVCDSVNLRKSCSSQWI